MRIMVTGSNGMLGKSVVKAVSSLGIDVVPMTHESMNIVNISDVGYHMELHQPDIVINCAGIVSSRSDVSLDTMYRVNGKAPVEMARLCSELDIRMVQVSTDCVFKGDVRHIETDVPNAEDNYGKSKIMGEVDFGEHLTIRCSFVGIGQRGLLNWLMSQHGDVKGYSKVYWNGMTVEYAARNIVALALKDVRGILHIFGEDNTKYDVLKLANQHFKLGLNIESVEWPKCDNRLYTEKGYLLILPPLEQQMEEMANAYCGYPGRTR